MISGKGEHMKITDLGAGLRVYQAEQQAAFVKSLLSGKNRTDSADIFGRKNTDIFTYKPSPISDIINKRFAAEIAKYKMSDNSALKNPELDGVVLDDDGYPITAYQLFSDKKIAARKERNEQMSDLLQKNGIRLSDDESYNFSVDSSTFKVTVTGKNDKSEKRAAEIEKVLNDNNFGSEILHTAMQASRPAERLATPLEQLKYNTNFALQSKFGCFISDITFDEKGNAILPNGKSIADELANEPQNAEWLSSDDKNVQNVGKAAVSGLQIAIEKLRKNGIDSINNVTVNIDYDNSGFTDTMTEGYGFGKGQLGWYDTLKNLRGDVLAVQAYGNRIIG
jgi:hypothetical protein